MAVLLISEQYLKDNTIINDNVDSKLLASAIAEAQDIHIRDILGSVLYEDLLAKIALDADLSSYSSYKTLMDSYILPALKYYAIYRSLLPMTVKMMNKSVMTRTSDNANSISMDDIYKLEERFLNLAESYGQRLIDYLCDNSTNYPKYLEHPTTGHHVHPRKTSFTSGMFLDNI